MRKQNIARFLVVLGFSFVLAACGSSTTTDKDQQVDPPVVDTSTTTGLDVSTTSCLTSEACANAYPIQVTLVIEWKRPKDNAWIKIGEVDSGPLGNVILGMPVAGTYRFKAKTAPAGATTNPTVSAVVVKDNVNDVFLSYEMP